MTRRNKAADHDTIHFVPVLACADGQMGNNIRIESWTMSERAILEIDDAFEGISTILRHIIIGILDSAVIPSRLNVFLVTSQPKLLLA